MSEGLYLTTATRRLIGRRPWHFNFLRQRAVESLRAIELLEGAGDMKSAEKFYDAVMSDVLLDTRIEIDRQLAEIHTQAAI